MVRADSQAQTISVPPISMAEFPRFKLKASAVLSPASCKLRVVSLVTRSVRSLPAYNWVA